MWAIPTSTSLALKKKTDIESQYMVSHPELGSVPPIGSGRESGCDTSGYIKVEFLEVMTLFVFFFTSIFILHYIIVFYSLQI